MKLLLFLSAFLLVGSSRESCGHKKAAAPAGCYHARLEIKAACMNYTISVLSEGIDPSLVVPKWTDETTGKTYRNVFALDSRCNFPSGLNAGDEFYFRIDSNSTKSCAVCMIYYPVPPKKLAIAVYRYPPCDATTR